MAKAELAQSYMLHPNIAFLSFVCVLGIGGNGSPQKSSMSNFKIITRCGLGYPEKTRYVCIVDHISGNSGKKLGKHTESVFIDTGKELDHITVEIGSDILIHPQGIKPLAVFYPWLQISAQNKTVGLKMQASF